MATASVVELFPKSTPQPDSRIHGPASRSTLSADILQFPRPRTLEERIRARVEATARNMPPMAYPVDIEFSTKRMLSLANWLIAEGKYNRFWVQKLEA